MNLVLIFVTALLVGCGARATPPAAPVTPTTTATPVASGKLEMKPYFLVLLRRGPAWTPESTPETKQLFEGHMANIEAMARSGKLIIAGPTDAGPDDRQAVAGIFIFDVPSREEVDAMLREDPAIVATRLVPEVMPWWGPANISYPGKLVPAE